MGFGINAGDQQYVNGIRRVSASRGPSDDGTGSSPNDSFLQEFTKSPSLKDNKQSAPVSSSEYSRR